jgi:glycosyltransferase involved in cell wall biosynthesis
VKYFDRIYIIPADTGFSDVKVHVPHEKITFIDLDNYTAKNSGISTALFRLNLLFQTISYAISNKKTGYLSLNSLSYEFAYLKKIANLQSRFEVFLDNLEKGKFYGYSYWFDIWPLILSKANIKNRFSRVISRAHGFDIFAEQQKHRFDPYFKIKYKNVDLVSSVSLKGKSILKAKLITKENKIIHNSLGVMRHAESYKTVGEGPLLIVSCSILTELKRVFLIPEILKLLKVDYKWIHFGDGSPEEISVVKKAIEKYQVNGELKGYVSNSDLMSFYKENTVNLFVNVSSSEGIPFSIMEAMSFGIPCMATDVGGNSEIVDENNGFLIPAGFNPKIAANNINSLSPKTQNSKREQAFKRWEEKFNAERNYKAFYGLLIGSN